MHAEIRNTHIKRNIRVLFWKISPTRLNDWVLSALIFSVSGFSKNENIKFTDPKNGVLDYMADCEVMLGVESSTSFEWLLFNRPIVFLKDSPFLRHGLYINTYSINKAIDIALKEDLFQEIRLKLRNKLISHLDGLYSFRFNNLVDELELQL